MGGCVDCTAVVGVPPPSPLAVVVVVAAAVVVAVAAAAVVVVVAAVVVAVAGFVAVVEVGQVGQNSASLPYLGSYLR